VRDAKRVVAADSNLAQRSFFVRAELREHSFLGSPSSFTRLGAECRKATGRPGHSCDR
jgi:hypothetical protein